MSAKRTTRATGAARSAGRSVRSAAGSVGAAAASVVPGYGRQYGSGELRILSAWAFFGYTVLFSIPIIGWVFLIIFALNNNNICRRNFARSYFIFLLLVFLLSLLANASGFFRGLFDWWRPY